MHLLRKLSFVSLIMTITLKVLAQSPAPGIVKTEFIYETAPFPQCHASTIALGNDGLVAAWFGGTREKHPDVGVWLSRQDGKSWTPPAPNRVARS